MYKCLSPKLKRYTHTICCIRPWKHTHIYRLHVASKVYTHILVAFSLKSIHTYTCCIQLKDILTHTQYIQPKRYTHPYLLNPTLKVLTHLQVAYGLKGTHTQVEWSFKGKHKHTCRVQPKRYTHKHVLSGPKVYTHANRLHIASMMYTLMYVASCLKGLHTLPGCGRPQRYTHAYKLHAALKVYTSINDASSLKVYTQTFTFHPAPKVYTCIHLVYRFQDEHTCEDFIWPWGHTRVCLAFEVYTHVNIAFSLKGKYLHTLCIWL